MVSRFFDGSDKYYSCKGVDFLLLFSNLDLLKKRQRYENIYKIHQIIQIFSNIPKDPKTCQ